MCQGSVWVSPPGWARVAWVTMDLASPVAFVILPIDSTLRALSLTNFPPSLRLVISHPV